MVKLMKLRRQPDAVFVAKIELEVLPVYVWMAERNQQ